MADRKISELALAEGANLHDDTLLAIVDLLEAAASDQNLKATLLQLAGVIAVRAAAGTADAPGMAFTADPDTGIFRQASNALGLAAGGVERARVTSAGLRIMDGGGVLLGTAATSTLSAYVSTTWTPSFGASTTAPTVTYQEQTGKYVRIGSLVVASFVVRTSAVSSQGVGNLTLTGLPIAASAGTPGGTMFLGFTGGWNAGNAPGGGTVGAGASVVTLWLGSTADHRDSMNGAPSAASMNTGASNANYMMGTVVYHV